MMKETNKNIQNMVYLSYLEIKALNNTIINRKFTIFNITNEWGGLY